MMKRFLLLISVSFLLFQACMPEDQLIWQIGENNNSGVEFALAPQDYSRYIENDFGWEDKYFLIGVSDPKVDWPYIIPGTSDTWGGT